MKDAISDSKNYAEDNSDGASDWYGCDRTSGDLHSALQIQCSGYVTVLVHGGELFKSDYHCDYNYQFVNKNQGYLVVEKNCE
jgi:hypothetical protein